jgi:hypothetical protein
MNETPFDFALGDCQTEKSKSKLANKFVLTIVNNVKLKTATTKTYPYSLNL